MKLKDGLEVVGNGAMYALTFTQTKEIFEIVSLVLSILISVIILLSKIVNWYKNAKQDGQISKEEIQDGINIVKEGVDTISSKVKKEECKDEKRIE